MLQNASLTLVPDAIEQQSLQNANNENHKQKKNTKATAGLVKRRKYTDFLLAFDLANHDLGLSSSSVESDASTSTKASHRSQYSLVLGLSSLNGTFERKSLVLPFYPDVLLLGRQTSLKTQPAPDNGFFDSRVLSRSHAEVWADYDTGRVWIKDSKSSNGTYVNSLRLGDEKSESEPHELRKNDIIELGIDIANEEGTSFMHRKISAKVDRISFMSLQAKQPVNQHQYQGSQTRQLQLHPGQMNKQPEQYQNGYTHKTNNINDNSNNNTNNTANNALSRSQRSIAGSALRPFRSVTESLDAALFGDLDASLEDISLSHARNSVSGHFMNSGVTSSATLELIVKKLVGEIHAAKVESAKIHSVGKLLEDISTNQQESRLLSEKLPALDEFKNQITMLSSQLEAAKQEIDEKNRHIFELERALAAAAIREPQPRTSSPDLLPELFPDPVTVSPASEKQLDTQESVMDREVELELPVDSDVKREVKSIDEGEPIAENPDSISNLETVLAELKETKNQLAFFKERAYTAESQAMKHSKTIGELRAISMGGSSTSGELSSTTTATAAAASAAAAATTDTKYGIAVQYLPMATTLGVVVLGMSFMAVINSLARESIK